jgi:hypothetical protein
MLARHVLDSGNMWKPNSLWSDQYARAMKKSWSAITVRKTARRATTRGLERTR